MYTVYSWTLGFSCSFIWKQCLFLDSFHSCPIAWNCFRSILILLHIAEITSRHQWCSWLIATVTVDEFWVGQHDYEMLAGGWVQEDVFPVFFSKFYVRDVSVYELFLFHNFPAISYYHVYDETSTGWVPSPWKVSWRCKTPDISMFFFANDLYENVYRIAKNKDC